jgi:hypothetical protein
MRLIAAPFHRVLDFVTVVGFAMAPLILGLTGIPAALCYLLAAVHLTVTLLTRFSPAERRPLPFGLHGAIELAVGISLAALPRLAGWERLPRTVFVAAGVVILGVWALSRYRPEASRAVA